MVSLPNIPPYMIYSVIKDFWKPWVGRVGPHCPEGPYSEGMLKGAPHKGDPSIRTPIGLPKPP